MSTCGREKSLLVPSNFSPKCFHSFGVFRCPVSEQNHVHGSFRRMASGSAVTGIARLASGGLVAVRPEAELVAFDDAVVLPVVFGDGAKFSERFHYQVLHFFPHRGLVVRRYVAHSGCFSYSISGRITCTNLSKVRTNRHGEPNQNRLVGVSLVWVNVRTNTQSMSHGSIPIALAIFFTTQILHSHATHVN